MSENSPADASGGQFYNLSEIPFEPTGAATEKYPYVAPKKFVAIEEKMDEVVNEKKLYVVLFRAPQGGGKTATAAELKRRIDAKKYAGGKVAIILNRLLDLEFAHYTASFLEEAKPLLPGFKWERYEGKTSPGELKNAVSAVLKSLGHQNKLVVWVIDEFDILVDYPKEKQSQFLQVLREIIDEISNESLPVLFIMSHTVKSSKEFEKHLRDIHGPLHSRVVATLDIGYSYSEVRAIVAARLESVRKKELLYNSIEPFTDDSLRELYNLVLATGGTGELNDFRLFERCCYFAILHGSQEKEGNLRKNLVQDEFQRLFKSWAKPETNEKLSLALRGDRSSILAGTQMMRNEATLRGLEKGLKLMTDQFSELLDVKTRDIGELPSGVRLGSLQCFAHHKPTGKRVSALWLLASKGGGLILPDDLREINATAASIRSETISYINLVIVSYVSEFDLDTAQLTNATQVIRISPDTMKDLIGLGLESATKDDIDTLRRSFDSDIARAIRHIFEDSTRDITKGVTETVQHLAVTLNVVHSTGSKLTKESLKDANKKLFRSGRAQDRHIADLIALGFAREEGTEIVPMVPKALSQLDQVLRTQGPLELDAIQKQFGPNSEAILHVSKSLGLVKEDENGKVSRLLGNEGLENVVNPAKAMLSKDALATYDGEQAALLVKAVEKSSPESIPGGIVASAARAMLPKFGQGLTRFKPVAGDKQVTDRLSTAQTSDLPAGAVASPKQRYEPAEFEKTALAILSAKPVTLEELKRELVTQGFSTDVNPKIMGLVLQNKVKLVSS